MACDMNPVIPPHGSSVELQQCYIDAYQQYVLECQACGGDPTCEAAAKGAYNARLAACREQHQP